MPQSLRSHQVPKQKTHKFYETERFKHLQAKWYKKLLLESPKKSKKLFESRSTLLEFSALHNNSPVTNDAKLKYCMLLSRRVRSEGFIKERDKIIMRARAEGIMIKDILVLLENKGIKCHRNTVRFIIRRYEVKWKIRKWKPQQLTSNRLTV